MEFNELLGKTIIKIEGAENDSDRIEFIMESGEKYSMWHSQDCCERVCVEDVIGDIKDLISFPLTMAEESISNDNPEGITKEYQESFTCTFYKLATMKGYVTIRWYGASNGYYSESVEFTKL